MVKYIGQRLVAAVPVLVVVVIAAFALLHVAPGDPAALIAGDNATPTQIHELHRKLGLDQPLYMQLGIWVKNLAHGDFGKSIFSGETLTKLVGQRIQPTLALAILGELIAICIGVPLGVLAARRRNSWLDRGVMIFAVLGFAMPSFWLGYNLIFLFSLDVHWLPPTGYRPISAGIGPFLKYLILPSLTLGFGVAALIARMTRATMLEVLRQDYVRTARAKGLREQAVLVRHAAKNAAIPVLTVIGLSVAYVLSGSVIIETVFSIPGMGRLFAEAAINRDYPIVQGTILVTGVLFVLVNLLVDLSYVLFDPRIRYYS
ncbi:MAG TPA: ABC transporter permease [Dehalococcoidia bacterium]|nr:ABC transporter permease [Dehalococcoidia bacterium]